jgi:hypothetical protein
MRVNLGRGAGLARFPRARQARDLEAHAGSPVPTVSFTSLPDDARCWVFGAHGALDEVDSARLLGAVDAYLSTWKAHGASLTSAREFRDEHFLVVGVDERASGVSGCSIDGLFTVLQEIEKGIGTSMVGGGLVYFRQGEFVLVCTRGQFELMSAEGEVDAQTPVFDTTVTTVGAYRTGFERRAGDSWHAALLKKGPQTRK